MIVIGRTISSFIAHSSKSAALLAGQSTASFSKMKVYSVHGESQGKGSKSIAHDGSTIISGTGTPGSSGPTPIEGLLSAVMGCEYFTALMVSREMGFQIYNTSHKVEGVRDENGVFFKPIDADAPVTSALQKITGTVIVDTDATQDQLDQLSKILKKRCPVARMVVDSGCEVDIKWTKKQ